MLTWEEHKTMMTLWSIAKSPLMLGADLEAVNRVRTRAGQPEATAVPEAYKVARTSHGELPEDHPFRLLVRNERAVELCYEGHYWWDMRRWKRAHLVEDKLREL